mmetsp:Transcript_20803/g.19838  ORF Transcript_20803/g.19838 Transcript_20803/m.19838 type:complete len:93 (-) Transcript_20803:961-1239(-)
MVINDLNLNWPSNVNSFFAKFTVLMGSGSSILKVNCLFQKYDLNTTINPYYVSLIFYALAPILYALLSGFVCMIIAMIKYKNKANILNLWLC